MSVEPLIAIDLDGTLEDSRADMTASARRVRARLGLPSREDAALRPFMNQGMAALYANCFGDYIAAGDAAARSAEVREAYDADYLAHLTDETRLYDGVADALRELAALGRLACVTNKPEAVSRRLLDALGVGRRFATVVGGDTCGVAKPDPLMLVTAARRGGVGPDARAVMIGDTAGDVKMGRAFGAKTVWCAWGYAEKTSESPDFTAAAPRDLPRIVRAALGLELVKEN